MSPVRRDTRHDTDWTPALVTAVVLACCPAPQDREPPPPPPCEDLVLTLPKAHEHSRQVRCPHEEHELRPFYAAVHCVCVGARGRRAEGI